MNFPKACIASLAMLIGLPALPANAQTIETIQVDSQLADCTGVGPMKCMRVKKSNSREWEFFYNGIIGFEFKPGYRYKLRVAVSKVKSPAADASRLSYRLVKVLSKKRVK